MLVDVALLKITWPIWKAVDALVSTRCLQGNASIEIEGRSFVAHLVLIPQNRSLEFTQKVTDFFSVPIANEKSERCIHGGVLTLCSECSPMR